MTTFAILLGGSLTVTPRLVAMLEGARSIAADGGMRHADGLGLVPELWVGDFDSTPDGLPERFAGIPRQAYPAAKALTDGEIAVSEALARGATGLVLVGALSGERSDHAMMHVLQALSLAADGHEVMLASGEEEAWPLHAGRCHFDLPAGSLFSILAFGDLAGLTIEGARYPLDRFDMPFGSSRTLSNVALGPVTVDLKSGRALLIARPFDHSGA